MFHKDVKLFYRIVTFCIKILISERLSALNCYNCVLSLGEEHKDVEISSRAKFITLRIL